VNLDTELPGAALTAQLVDIPSVSGEEGPLADAVEAALRSRPHLTVHRDGNAIVARTTLGRPERVVLAGHLDTVPIAGNVPSRLDGSRLYGCGSTDMKAGVAVQLRLAAGLTAPARDVTYVFYDCEEVAADRNGLLRLSRRSPELLAGDFAVLMEPSSAEIEGGCQGTLRAEVTAAGKRAHTARSWMGRNAIHEAGPILDVLRGYTPREPDVDGLRYHEGLNAVAIRGGVAGNVVPDECVVTVNYRFAPDRDGEQAADFVRSLFAAWPVTVLDVAEGARPGLGHPAAAAFVAAVGGTARAKLGWTDVARFAALGIPAVNYGPGISEIAHTADEYVPVEKIAQCEDRLRAWLQGLSRRAGGQLHRGRVPGPADGLPADRDDRTRVVPGGNAGQRAGGGDGLAVDGEDHVTGRQPAGLGRRAAQHAEDQRPGIGRRDPGRDAELRVAVLARGPVAARGDPAAAGLLLVRSLLPRVRAAADRDLHAEEAG
jgi:succinyl-diaminopimelate desuccinylase